MEPSNYNLRGVPLCMGEFPLFPGWLFFEEPCGADIRIVAYGSQGRIVACVSPNREFALAECLRKILQPER